MLYVETSPCITDCPVSTFPFFPRRNSSRQLHSLHSRCRSTFCFPPILIGTVKYFLLISETAGNWVLYASSMFLYTFCFLLLSFPSSVRNNVLATHKVFWSPGMSSTYERIWSEFITFINLYILGQNAEFHISNSH